MVKNPLAVHKTGRAQAQTNKQGSAGYDNIRENIDPHVKTKVLDTKEIVINGTQISGAYLAIDGSNANTTIDIGSQAFTTSGSITSTGTQNASIQGGVNPQLTLQNSRIYTGGNKVNFIVGSQKGFLFDHYISASGFSTAGTISGANLSFAGAGSIDVSSMLIKDEVGNNAIHFQADSSNRRLYYSDGSTTSVNWQLAYLADASGSTSVDWENRALKDTTGTTNFTYGSDLKIPVDSKKLYFGAADDYSIEWDGSDAVHTIGAGDFVFTGGNVGIGTSSPSATLDVVGTAEFNLTDDTATAFLIQQGANGYFCVDTTNGSEHINIGCVAIGPLIHIDTSEVVINDGSSDIDFRVESDNSTNALFVQGSDGKVGIGTAAPSNTLHIYGADVTLGIDNTKTGNGAVFFLKNSGTNTAAIISYADSHATLKDELWIKNYRNDDIVLAPNNTERMRITSAGNVGIGITNPASKLTSYSATAYNDTSLANAESTALLSLHHDTSIGGAGMIFTDSNASWWAINSLVVGGTSTMTFSKNGNAIMTIDQGGKVGIGTTSPSAKLEVNGSISGSTLFSTTGFTGSGSYTNFVISGGIIISAS